jgi:hypothetical protein
MARHRNDDFPLHSFGAFDGCAFGHATQSPLLLFQLAVQQAQRSVRGTTHAVARFDDCGVHLASERDVAPFEFAEDPAGGRL